ncbi:MAG TPA: hypothetical protein VD993_03400 [Chitinophagaceae bacterium]|nr:hypothetical protein [Chitinophagaceae bacterium]
MTDTELLDRCRELIRQQLGWPPVREWNSASFSELSQKILEATNVGLSTTTLKNALETADAPSPFTLNTLAMYLGYENWENFRTRQTTMFTPLSALMPPQRGKLVTYTSFFAGVILLGLLVLGGFVFMKGCAP